LQALRSLLYTSWLFVGTATYAVIVLLVCWLPVQRLYRIANSWSANQLWMLKFLCGLSYAVEGRENIPPGHHVYFMKHSSTWETYAIMILFEPLVWVMKREIYWIPFVGWGCMLAKCIAIDRKAGTAAVNQVLAQGKDRMERYGAWVAVFPEGTRMAPGETRRYGSSGTLLAAQENRKIIPVAHNAGYFWPRRGVLKKRGTVRVIIGPPIEAAGRDAREVNNEAQAWIESHVIPPEDVGR
jgi:1-acyl-sn-glycerol-3-phosphate acyltransferase